MIFMYELRLLNLKTGEKFSKFFNSEYLFSQFKHKCRKSKKIKIIGEYKNI